MLATARLPTKTFPRLVTATAISRVEDAAQIAHCVVIDWWQGCLPRHQMFKAIAAFTRESSVAPTPARVPRGMQAYRRAMQVGDGAVICYDNRFGHQTCAVIMSGRGCRRHSVRLLARLRQLGATATRIDVAFDDVGKRLTRSHFEEAVRSRQVVGHFKTATTLTKMSLSSHLPGPQASGWGMLFGSRESDSCVRVYDKGAHLRVELELKGAQAESFTSRLWDDVLAFNANDMWVTEKDLVSPSAAAAFRRLALQTLKAKLSFRDRTADSNVTRAPTCSWWNEFLEYFDPDAEKAKKEYEQMKAAKLAKWVEDGNDPDLFVPPWRESTWEEFPTREKKQVAALRSAKGLLTELLETHKHRLIKPSGGEESTIQRSPTKSHLRLLVFHPSSNVEGPKRRPPLKVVAGVLHNQSKGAFHDSPEAASQSAEGVRGESVP
jgi:hypothetical protein